MCPSVKINIFKIEPAFASKDCPSIRPRSQLSSINFKIDVWSVISGYLHSLTFESRETIKIGRRGLISAAIFVQLRRRFTTQIVTQQCVRLWIVRLTYDWRHNMIIPTVRIVVSNYYSCTILFRKFFESYLSYLLWRSAHPVDWNILRVYLDMLEP